jgi:hypothetical protein
VIPSPKGWRAWPARAGRRNRVAAIGTIEPRRGPTPSCIGLFRLAGWREVIDRVVLAPDLVLESQSLLLHGQKAGMSCLLIEENRTPTLRRGNFRR